MQFPRDNPSSIRRRHKLVVNVGYILVPTHGLGEARNSTSGCYIERNHKERVLKLNQHLNVKAVAERFEVMKTSMIPGVVGGSQQ